MIDYNAHIGTIKWFASHYHKKTGIEMDELISAGNECFVIIQKTFDPSKSCFNTYLVWKLKGLYSGMKRGIKNQDCPYYEKATNINPSQVCSFSNSLMELPNDAREIIEIIFNIPSDLIKIFPKKQPRGINKNILMKYLKNNGWGVGRILKAFNRIEEIWG